MSSSTNNQNIKPNQYTLRCSALRIESPFLKHDAVYFLRYSRREYSCTTQFSATAKFGVALFRNCIPSSAHHPQHQHRHHHHSRRLSVIPSTDTANNMTAQQGFPARESSFWERPACLLNFKPSGNTVKVKSSNSSSGTNNTILDQDPNNNVNLSSQNHNQEEEIEIPTYSEKILKIEILESLIPNQSLIPSHQNNNNKNKDGTCSTMTASYHATLEIIGSVEIDLGKMFTNSSNNDTRRVFSSSSNNNSNKFVQSCFVSQVRIPFRFGTPPNDVGAELYMSFRFDAGDDVKRTPSLTLAQLQAMEVESNKKEHAAAEEEEAKRKKNNNTKFSAVSNSNDANFQVPRPNANDDDDDLEEDAEHYFGNAKHHQDDAMNNEQAISAKEKKKIQKEKELAEKKAAERERLQHAKSNTTGRAISTVLPPITTTVSAMAVLQDLLNMLSEEQQEEPGLIRQINELTNKKKTLVLNNLLGINNSEDGSPGLDRNNSNVSSSNGDHHHSATHYSALPPSMSFSAQNSRKVKDIQERLTSATNELLRTVCCDRMVMMYRVALQRALEESEKREVCTSKSAERKRQEKEEEQAELKIRTSANTNDDDDDDQEKQNEEEKEEETKVEQDESKNTQEPVYFDEEMLSHVRERTKFMIQQIQSSSLWFDASEVMENRWKNGTNE